MSQSAQKTTITQTTIINTHTNDLIISSICMKLNEKLIVNDKFGVRGFIRGNNLSHNDKHREREAATIRKLRTSRGQRPAWRHVRAPNYGSYPRVYVELGSESMLRVIPPLNTSSVNC